MKNSIRHLVIALILFAAIGCFAQNKVKIAFIGNSITFANAMEGKSYANIADSIIQKNFGAICDIRNYGNPGKRMFTFDSGSSYMATSSFTDALAFVPDICFISLGTNDSYDGVWAPHSAEFYVDYLTMINTIKARNPLTSFVLCYPTPIVHTVNGYNDAAIVNGVIPEIARVLANTKNTQLLDWHTLMTGYGSLFPDNIHPNKAGSHIMGEFAYNKLLTSDLLTSGSSTTNLAAGKTTTVSSTTGTNTGVKAVDSTISTRWESAYSDPQWIYVDLGVKTDIGGVRVVWEGAYGKDYQIQVSDNTTTWTTIKTVTGNTSLYNNHTGLVGSGRYVRINGTARGTIFGYSIREFKVYAPVIYKNDITHFAGTISAQYSDSPATENISKLIDNNPNTKFLTFHNAAWVQFTSSNSYIVNSYSMTSGNDDATRDPLNWTLQGSNNGSAWTTIDTRSNEDFPNRLQTRTFSFTNSTAYTYYRFNYTNNSGTVLQLSEIELFGISNSVISGATYRMVAAHSGKVMEVSGALTSDGANVAQYSNLNGTNQQWVINDVGAGYYRLSAANSGKALEVAGSALNAGANVQQSAYISGANQQWSITADGSGLYKILNRNSGKALEVWGNSMDDNANVQQYDYFGQNNQKWQLLQVLAVRSATIVDPIEEVKPVAEIAVYPNPVSDVLHIEGLKKESDLTVYNTLGMMIKNEKGISINVSDLVAGTYLVKIKSEQGSVSKLFLKK